MFELEIKIQIDEEKETEKKILNMGGKKLYTMQNIDQYYNAPEKLKDYSQTDEALRIRSTILSNQEKYEIIEETHDLTYKGPKLDNVVKSRIEHVCNINNAKTMDLIIQALGFRKVITIDKLRTVYHLNYMDYALEVLIDKVEYLDGYFLEAEIMAEKEEQMEEIRKVLIAFLEEIGYSEQDTIIESYLELVLKEKNTL